MSGPAERALRAMHRPRVVWQTLTSSLWFIPSAIVTAAIVVALVLIEATGRVDSPVVDRYPRLLGAGAAGARDMLSTIAGSVITVAGVTFSITIVALAQASTQYTPRILRTFMRARSNQIVLGSFLGIFTYCLVVLRAIRGGDEGAFVPSIAVLGGFVLALVGVGVLIFFIHHIARSLQAATILERVRHETETAIDHLFPEPVGPPEDIEVDRGPNSTLRWYPIAAANTGYIQNVDEGGLLDFARNHDVAVRMERSVGAFIVARSTLVSVGVRRPSDDATAHPVASGAESSLNELFTINAYRTVHDDAAFGLLQIVDIALKALSPSANDTTTAVTCVDQLGALLARLVQRRIGPRETRDGGRLRVIAARPTFEEFLSLAFDDVRRSAESNVTVLERLMEALATIGEFAYTVADRRLLIDHLGRITEAAGRSVTAPSDRAALVRRSEAVRHVLTQATAPPLPKETTP